MDTTHKFCVPVHRSRGPPHLYSYVFRHKDVRECTASAMAFYLFLRFHVANEPWPDFSDMVRWQKIKLLRTRDDPMKKLSYHAQNLAIKNCFRDHNINLTGWTHLGRKAGCQLGEALDVPDANIRR